MPPNPFTFEHMNIIDNAPSRTFDDPTSKTSHIAEIELAPILVSPDENDDTDRSTATTETLDATTAEDISSFNLSKLELGKVVGYGSFCKVQEIVATDLDLDCLRNNYVVKQLRSSLEYSDRSLGISDLCNEAKCLRNLSHPNIIRMRGVASEEEENCSFCGIILDRVERTLEDEMESWDVKINFVKRSWWKCTNYKNFMKDLWVERINAAYGISSAMQYLHGKKIIYRDLKPQNIGFDYTGNVKLFDFGLAKKLTLKNLVENNYNLTGLTGSMRYMSPEVFNEKPYNLSADTYSFGILFWYICSLSVPFLGYSMEMMLSDVANGFTRPEINRSWPKECTNIMENSWKANPDLRPTMSNINADLSAALKYYTKRYG